MESPARKAMLCRSSLRTSQRRINGTRIKDWACQESKKGCTSAWVEKRVHTLKIQMCLRTRINLNSSMKLRAVITTWIPWCLISRPCELISKPTKFHRRHWHLAWTIWLPNNGPQARKKAAKLAWLKHSSPKMSARWFPTQAKKVFITNWTWRKNWPCRTKGLLVSVLNEPTPDCHHIKWTKASRRTKITWRGWRNINYTIKNKADNSVIRESQTWLPASTLQEIETSCIDRSPHLRSR